MCDIFKNRIKVNDFIIVSHGNTKLKAIAQVTGEYFFLPESEAYENGVFTGNIPVKWIYHSNDLLPYEKILKKRFIQKTLYNIKQNIKMNDFKNLINHDEQSSGSQNYVLVIDEINRGNISKIFGELITLIETSKRAGNKEAIALTLPYSGDKFSVPNNLYIIGTMNTADRSIALMDTALRRRFEFVEMPAKPELLKGIAILDKDNSDTGINIQLMLEKINQRIEYLYDRDHTIGHAYFMGINKLTELNHAFANKIIPLLQEYFYDDWEKIRLVLADNQTKGYQFIQSASNSANNLFGGKEVANIEPEKIIYIINDDLAKGNLQAEAFIKIYDVDAINVDHASSSQEQISNK